jgi:hypothetical protein
MDGEWTEQLLRWVFTFPCASVPSPHPLDQKRRAWKALKGNQDVARLNRLNQSLFLEKKNDDYGTYHKEPWRESIQLWWRESVMIHHSPQQPSQEKGSNGAEITSAAA